MNKLKRGILTLSALLFLAACSYNSQQEHNLTSHRVGNYTYTYSEEFLSDENKIRKTTSILLHTNKGETISLREYVSEQINDDSPQTDKTYFSADNQHVLYEHFNPDQNDFDLELGDNDSLSITRQDGATITGTYWQNMTKTDKYGNSTTIELFSYDQFWQFEKRNIDYIEDIIKQSYDEEEVKKYTNVYLLGKENPN